MERLALCVADSIFNLKTSSGGKDVVWEVKEAFREQFRLDVQFNDYRHGAKFQKKMLEDLKTTLSENHSFVWIISMVNDLFNHKNLLVWDRDGIARAGREYRKLLAGRNHVIVFGGRGTLKFELNSCSKIYYDLSRPSGKLPKCAGGLGPRA